MDSLKTEKIRVSKQADVFITKTATKTLTSTSVVEKVVNFHFRDLLKALKTDSTVEISGFGKFVQSKKKMIKKHAHLVLTKGYFVKQLDNPLRRRELTEARIEKIQGEIDYLEERIEKHETRLQANLPRMEEPFSSSERVEGDDNSSLRGENEDMQELSNELGEC